MHLKFLVANQKARPKYGSEGNTNGMQRNDTGSFVRARVVVQMWWTLANMVMQLKEFPKRQILLGSRVTVSISERILPHGCGYLASLWNSGLRHHFPVSVHKNFFLFRTQNIL
jgi:hypothetical protein